MDVQSVWGNNFTTWRVLYPEAVQHRIDQDTLPVLHRRLDSLLLSRLLLLEEEQLYSLTLHRFASRFTQPRHAAPSVPTQPNDRRSISSLEESLMRELPVHMRDTLLFSTISMH